MAMGGVGSGSMKHSSSNRGLRPYAMMLLLAFGAAIFGVMVLHKFRERRIFSILIKDKDRDIITLQLLLQKERDYSKEMKKKVEELKGKAQSLRTQKVDLNHKIMDWQSRAASFKEEARVMEVELEEKKNELKLLKEREMNSSQDISQVSALTVLLKQKDTELQEMKSRLENPVNVWSVSADDPSNPHVNLTATEQVVNAKDGVSLTSESEGKITDQNATVLEWKPKAFQNVQDIGEKDGEPGQSKGVSGDNNLEKADNFKGGEGLSTGEQVGNNNETDEVKNKEMNGVPQEVDGKGDGMPERLQNVENSGVSGEDNDSVQRMSKRWRDIYRKSELEKARNSDKVEKQDAEKDIQTDTTMGDEGLERRMDNNHQAGLEGKEIQGHLRLGEGNIAKSQLYETNQKEISTRSRHLRNPEEGGESNEQVGNARKMVSVDLEPGEGEASNAGDAENAGEDPRKVASDAVEQEPTVVLSELNNIQNAIPRRELPGRRTTMSKRHKVPKSTKLRKTWKSTVLENSEDY